MCTSITGPSKAFSASRMATDVWVKAAGIDDDAGGRFARLVDPVDDLVFAVALMERDLKPELGRQRRQSASTSARVSWP